ncbi:MULTISPECIES: helix-turn-helix domain-containing protein [Paenibacillus]|uniref:helix-turn-helix domain-containing protein n=1 Tax=Paenibacillus TaxID=44249 RepID=UPI00351F6C40
MRNETLRDILVYLIPSVRLIAPLSFGLTYNLIVNELLGSVTRASELINISQPAVTAQIKKFEKEISLSLLMPLGRDCLNGCW